MIKRNEFSLQCAGLRRHSTHSTLVQELMPSTFTVEVNVAAVIEPNREHLVEGYRGDADAPHAHLHKCNFPPARLVQGDQAHHSRDPRQTILMASS